MAKIRLVAIIIGAVIFSYLMLMMFMPTVLTVFQSVGAQLAARLGIEKYPGVVQFIAYVPWALWFVPAAAGVVALYVVLKREDQA